MANKFLSNINLTAGLEADGNEGGSGQVLSSLGPGNGVEWIDQASIESSSNLVYFDVKNETGSTISKGKGVMAVGTDGNSGHILIDEMVADGSIESKYFLGVLETTVDNGGFARVISFGQLDQFNTNGQNGETWSDGQVLWCDPANDGDFTITEPDGPNVKIAAAFILNSSTNGKIQVRVQANEGIHDLHDTKITSQVDGDVLVWDNTTGVWFNDSTLNVDYTNGRVGIGTIDPLHTLSINGTVSSNFFRGYTYPDNSFLDFDKDDTAAANYTALASIGRIAYLADTNTNEPTANAAHEFFTGTSDIDTATSLMIIQTDGKVGIGTDDPGALLEVFGTGNSFRLDSAANGSKEILFRNVGTGTATIKTDGDLKLYTEDANKNILFETTGGEKMRIEAGGNVGIGTTSPKATLDVKGGYCVDTKSVSITQSPTTVLTVRMSNHTGCYVKLTAFGDWGAHSSIAYLGEFFLQNGADGYAEPGAIIRQEDNTHTDAIQAEIVDPGGTGTRDFTITLRATATASFTAQLTYNIQGQFISVS